MDLISSFFDYYIKNPNQLSLTLVLFAFCFIFYRSAEKRVSTLIQAKDQEIERLADDNRKYREIYLVNIKGLAVEEYNSMSETPVD